MFRTIFRGTGWSFANDNDFSHVSQDPKYWDSVNEKFYKKYKGIDQQHYKWKDLILSGEPIEGPLGRSWKIPVYMDPKVGLKIPWTTLSNYPVQGTGADVMKIARISFYNRLMKKNWSDVKLIQTVHDSIVVDTPNKYTQDIVNMFHEVFHDLQSNIYKLFKYEWVVPLECECKIGKNQAEAIEVKPTI